MTDDVVSIVKLHSVGDWEGLFIGGELVNENHQGRVDVISYLEEGMTLGDVVVERANLPEEQTRYPTNLSEIIESDEFDFTMELNDG